MDAQLVCPGVVFPDPDEDAADQWLAAVHALARGHGGRVLGGMHGPSVDRNFYSATVAFPTGTVTLLLNTGARLAACVVGERPFPANARFVDVPSPDLFLTLGLNVANVSDMQEPLTDDHLAGLVGEEAEQARYHYPQRVGDLLFNWFD